MKKKPIVCLDFDGVIHSYTSGWQGAAVISDPPVDGAIEAILRYMQNYTVAIYSSRSHQWGGKRAMKRWLKHHLTQWLNKNYETFPDNDPYMPMYDEATQETLWVEWYKFNQLVNFHPGMDPWDKAVSDWADKVIRRISWPWFKPPAILTIDDRAVTFTGAFPTVADIAAFKPWNKK